MMETKTKHSRREHCFSSSLSGRKHHRSVTLFMVTLTIVTFISTVNSSTLPVKSFPVFSPSQQTIEQQQRQQSYNSNKSPLVDSSSHRMLNNNGQKESEFAMNPTEVFPKQTALEIGMSYPLYGDADSSAFDGQSDVFGSDGDDEETIQLQELAKRAPNKWQGLQGGWGKRAPNNWNKLSAAWGKRRIPNNAAWNNLSGMWGKKRAKWNELSGMWGKRAAWRDMSGGWGKKKRSNAPHWNKLRGMWGKRSTLPLSDAENQQFGDEQQQQTMVQQFETQQQQPNYPNSEQFQQSHLFEMMSNTKKDH